MAYRLVGLFVIVGILTGLGACGSTQQNKQPSAVEKTKKSTPEIRPSWFSESNRTSTDSAFVYGYGMAVSYDSTKSLQRATEQAREDLKKTVDDSLEAIRSVLVKRAPNQNERFSSSSFLINLRNAAVKVTSNTQTERTGIKQEDRKWISFIRVRAPWSTLNDQLRSELSEYPEFLEML